MRRIPILSEWLSMGARIAVVAPFQLSTVLEVDWDARLVRRRYSSDENNYPSGGEKRLMGSMWAHHVLEEGRVFRASGQDELKLAFADHELLQSLGLQQALNVPVKVQQRVSWSLNLLRDYPPYSDAEVEAVERLLKAL